MPKNSNKITKRQRDVLDDLFAGVSDEQDILEKHKVNKRLYDKWLAEGNFAAEFERRLNAARRQSDLIIARCATVAASKLVHLTESKNSETARKACLDIITLLRPDSDKSNTDAPACGELDEPAELPPELASRLLAALAASNEPRAAIDK
jgi:hypothetical protein